MLRVSDRGIPPHMLHLYEFNDNKSSKSQLTGNTAQYSSFIAKVGNQFLSRLSALRAKAKSETFAPQSALGNNSRAFETQYLGETQIRDTRWRSS